jgi:hypothetical protein
MGSQRFLEEKHFLVALRGIEAKNKNNCRFFPGVNQSPKPCHTQKKISDCEFFPSQDLSKIICKKLNKESSQSLAKHGIRPQIPEDKLVFML